VHVTINVAAVVNLVNDAGYDYDPYRQLDAAARAYLTHRDGLPLLRLYAQDIGYDYSKTTPYYFSDGQYYAISCADYPQLFNMRDPSPQRRRQFNANVRHYPAHAFAPFTVREWVNVDPFTEPYHACLSWPHRVHRADPPVVPHQPMNADHVPVLILNGELDSLTPAAGGAHIHRQLGVTPSRHIIAANMVHLVGDEDRYGCGQTLVRRFLRDTSALGTFNASCAKKIPIIHTVGTFPRRLAHAAPAHGHASLRVRRLAGVALAAAGDAAVRYNYVNGNRDLGLRGGKVRFSPGHGSSYVAHLKHVRWTTDTVVSGTVTFSPHALSAHGSVKIHRTNRPNLRCEVSWAGDHATITAGGHHLHAPAP
jgi:hypothetical protein